MTRRTTQIRAVGMACPVGLVHATACAAMRGNISRRLELEYLGNDGEPIVASHLAQLGSELTRRERWMTLLVYALRDLCRAHGLAMLERTPILLAAPRDSNGHQPSPHELAAGLSNALGVSLDPSRLQVISEGSFGGFRALLVARHWLLEPSSSHRQVVVAAADSFIEARALLDLSRERRLLVAGNSDGVIPGEAAACLLLDSASQAGLAAISGIGMANEPGHIDNEIPLRGQGIAEAARQALTEAQLELHDMHFRLSDAAGDSYGFKEQVLVISKLLRQNMDEFPLWLAAGTLGHVGCAAGLCGLLTAVAAWSRGYAPGPRAIAYAGAADVNRAAVILEATAGNRASHG